MATQAPRQHIRHRGQPHPVADEPEQLTIAQLGLALREVGGGRLEPTRELRRLDAELVGNVSIRVLPTERPDTWEVQGRGELQLGTWQSIAAGVEHSVAIRTDGTMWFHDRRPVHFFGMDDLIVPGEAAPVAWRQQPADDEGAAGLAGTRSLRLRRTVEAALRIVGVERHPSSPSSAGGCP